jgi:hypothetical protein
MNVDEWKDVETMAAEMAEFECMVRVTVKAATFEDAAMAAVQVIAEEPFPVVGVRLADVGGRPGQVRLVHTELVESDRAAADEADMVTA